MLDSKTIEIIQATAPVLKAHSHQIGKRFYELLFAKAPELYNLFNQTNQKRGLQQEALGYAVYAAGENITNLEALAPVIRRISEKHRAIGIKDEQYPIVGETLLMAVKDVLGDAATDEIIAAWGKAYGYISDAFISLEKSLYEETEQQPGGWADYRSFTVDKKVKETEEVSSLYLKSEDGKPIAAYQAGQYLTIKADIPGEQYTHIRHYSLSEAPGRDYYRISVKREQASGNDLEGVVSNYLHEQVKVGDTLQFSAPAGDFTLSSTDRPVVFISGGIGITPLLSMLNTIANKQPQRRVAFVHATTNSQSHAFKNDVAGLEKSHPNLKSFVCYSSPTEEDRVSRNFNKEGRIDLDWLQSIIPDSKADFYFCGPIPFMQSIHTALKQWKIPKENIHFESFSPIAILDEE
ncbi:NO-inducible flavohemoprotein [Paenibacillus sp. sgz302251]|uniref:NO-inducible flavohemoprotein n=1 Tax=Paenibacillus sp. sgz302251 TaxID=3414493 RepID=UPI003C7D3499